MTKNVPLVLLYIRNGRETLFPVKDIDHALRIANAIADSDLLNNDVDYNMFDVCYFYNRRIGDTWEAEDGRDFTEFWEDERKK